MKTKLFTLIIFISFVKLANAQFDHYFGVKGGMNLTGISGLEDDISRSNRFTFAAGLFYNHVLSPHSSLQIEALYSAQGVEIESAGASDPGMVYQLDYLSVPILYRYHFTEKGSFSVHFGVQPAYLINSKVKIHTGDEEGVHDFDDYFAGEGVELNKFDVGLTAGLGFGIYKFSNFTISYTYGLMDIFKTPTENFGNHSMVQIGFAYPLVEK